MAAEWARHTSPPRVARDAGKAEPVADDPADTVVDLRAASDLRPSRVSCNAPGPSATPPTGLRRHVVAVPPIHTESAHGHEPPTIFQILEPAQLTKLRQPLQSVRQPPIRHLRWDKHLTAAGVRPALLQWGLPADRRRPEQGAVVEPSKILTLHPTLSSGIRCWEGKLRRMPNLSAPLYECISNYRHYLHIGKAPNIKSCLFG